MDKILQIIMIISSFIFTSFIVYMISKGKVELKYALTWLFTALTFIIISLFPSILNGLSLALHILTPVNALFLIIITFLLLIIFTLTVAISKIKNQVISISQEISILKEEIEKVDDINDDINIDEKRII
ncbi:DUF2304 domain-containing protein [Clostridium tarantellae]|uniref:DUF2304 family protein n=1 Tax=Clostridium tarantellae TaxID=39493 RepID=A0A6I1MI55_9CLOT|nr:DUF2304 domain-containing protein [Clostridium tarantellae]MPQ42584.1 DUF2304 family protein [Clostridium tarantellae]